MYIVLITTKKTEGLRSLVLVAYMVWAINFIIDDWYLMVRWFAHRQTLQAVMAMLCSGAGRDVFCRFSFMASLYSGAFSSWPCLVTNYVHIGASLLSFN